MHIQVVVCTDKADKPTLALFLLVCTDKTPWRFCGAGQRSRVGRMTLLVDFPRQIDFLRSARARLTLRVDIPRQIDFLRSARALGDFLIVGVHKDEEVRLTTRVYPCGQIHKSIIGLMPRKHAKSQQLVTY